MGCITTTCGKNLNSKNEGNIIHHHHHHFHDGEGSVRSDVHFTFPATFQCDREREGIHLSRAEALALHDRIFENWTESEESCSGDCSAAGEYIPSLTPRLRSSLTPRLRSSLTPRLTPRSPGKKLKTYSNDDTINMKRRIKYNKSHEISRSISTILNTTYVTSSSVVISRRHSLSAFFNPHNLHGTSSRLGDEKQGRRSCIIQPSIGNTSCSLIHFKDPTLIYSRANSRSLNSSFSNMV